jgi:hypothetical protein
MICRAWTPLCALFAARVGRATGEGVRRSARVKWRRPRRVRQRRFEGPQNLQSAVRNSNVRLGGAAGYSESDSSHCRLQNGSRALICIQIPVPSATECPHELHRCDEPPARQRHDGSLVVEKRRLLNCHLQVADETSWGSSRQQMYSHLSWRLRRADWRRSRR